MIKMSYIIDCFPQKQYVDDCHSEQRYAVVP